VRRRKKVLALVLAMAMSLSLAVTAGAAFNDQDKIVNTEAVDVCASLNIINGYNDGSFKPEGNVTRAEAAKMIAVALNGGKEPTLATKATPTYADIDGHWAEGFIEYCSTKGIVAGVGGGNFNPAGNVTGSQLAKMLLVALGYNADVEKMVGANWELYTNVLANQTGLYKDLEAMDPSDAASRDEAAQMIWNALQAKEIVKTSTIDREDGSISDMYAPGTQTMLKVKYDAEIETGVVTATGQTTKGWTVTTTGTVGSTGFTAMDEDASEFMGQKVKVVFKASDEVYGVYAHADTNVIATGVVADLDTATVGSDGKIDFATVEYKTIANESAVTVVAPNGTSLGTLARLNAACTAGSEMVLIDNTGDEKIDTAVVTPVKTAKVSFVSADTITLVAAENAAAAASYTTAIDFEDANVYEGIAKGDYITITENTYLADDMFVVEKADVVSGTVKGLKGTAEVMIDGTWYLTDCLNSKTFSIGDTVDFVAVNGVLYSTKVTEVAAATDFLVITSALNNEYGDVKAKAVLGDGTSSVITFSKVYDYGTNEYVDATTSNIRANELYAYKVVDGEYQVMSVNTAISNSVVEAKLGYDNGATSVEYTSKKINGDLIDEAAVVFVKDTEGTKVITGADVIAWKNTVTASNSGVNAYLYNTEGGYDYTKVAYITLTVEDPGASSDTMYGYVVADPYASELENGDPAMTISFWNGTEVVTVQDKNNTTALAKHDVISYTEAGDGIIKVSARAAKGATAAGSAWDQISAMSGDYLKFANYDGSAVANEYKVTDDTVVLYVNTANATGYADGTISIANKNDAGTLLGDLNAYFIAGALDSDDGAYELKLLVVETANKVDF